MLLTDHFLLTKYKKETPLRHTVTHKSHGGCSYFDSSLSLPGFEVQNPLFHLLFPFEIPNAMHAETHIKGPMKMPYFLFTPASQPASQPIQPNKVRMWKPIYQKKVNQSKNDKKSHF